MGSLYQLTQKAGVLLLNFIALFLFVVGFYQVASNIQCMPVMAMADTLLLITGVVTSVLIWRDLS